MKLKRGRFLSTMGRSQKLRVMSTVRILLQSCPVAWKPKRDPWKRKHESSCCQGMRYGEVKAVRERLVLVYRVVVCHSRKMHDPSSFLSHVIFSTSSLLSHFSKVSQILKTRILISDASYSRCHLGRPISYSRRPIFVISPETADIVVEWEKISR